MKRRRILLVDDEVGATRLLKANLESTNLYEVRVVNNAENAVPAARQFKPHLVILDVVMPRMTGTEVARELRRQPELQSVSIALLTAADKSLMPPDPDPAIDLLPRISKPASMEEILQFLHNNFSPQANQPGRSAQPQAQT